MTAWSADADARRSDVKDAGDLLSKRATQQSLALALLHLDRHGQFSERRRESLANGEGRMLEDVGTSFARFREIVSFLG